VIGAYTLLEAMRDADVKRFLFSSTAAVYGEPSHTPIKENAPLLPVSTYGNTKLTIERMISDCARGWGLEFISLRYFNAAGATSLHGEDHRPETHLIPIVLEKVMEQREEIIVYGNDYPTGDGTCIRDYIHVKDLAAAHVLGLEALLDGYHGALNLGNGMGFSVLDVIEAASEVTGTDIDYVIGIRREGDPAVLVASSKRAEEILGWKKKYPDIIDIIGDAYKWKKKFPKGYEK
jgi:UDP-glucose 4-epimerase